MPCRLAPTMRGRVLGQIWEGFLVRECLEGCFNDVWTFDGANDTAEHPPWRGCLGKDRAGMRLEGYKKDCKVG